jgi:hypothetical protein
MEPTLGQVTSNAKLSLRSGFAGNHIRAAIRDAREAYDLEQNNDTTQLAAWFDDILAHVPAAIVMAAAAFEANANEIVQDYLDQPSQLAAAQVCLFKDLLDDRSGNAIQTKRPPSEAAFNRYVAAGGSSSGGDAAGSFTRNFTSAALSINAAEILGS